MLPILSSNQCYINIAQSFKTRNSLCLATLSQHMSASTGTDRVFTRKGLKKYIPGKMLSNFFLQLNLAAYLVESNHNLLKKLRAM